MNFKKAYIPQKGYTPICKIGECSLKRLEFGIIELDANGFHFDRAAHHRSFLPRSLSG